jgi:hypothetical protein
VPSSAPAPFAASSFGVQDTGSDARGGTEGPEGAATCAKGGATGAAGGSATASVEAGFPLGDGVNVAPVGCGTNQEAAAASEDVQVLNQLEVEERNTVEQVGEKDLTPVTATIAAAVVPPCLRRSKRVVAVADLHTLHKVELLAAKKNLESKGTSFTSFSASQILSNLGRIGINLGSSDVAVIKNLEVDRLVLCAKQNKLVANSSTVDSEDEQDERLKAVLSHACGYLNENVLDMESDHIVDLAPVRRKKKYNNTKNLKNGKLPKKPKTPSKL